MQLEGTKSEDTELLLEKTKLEATKRLQKQIESKEPKFQSVEPKLDTKNRKTKEPVLEKYVKRHHGPNQIIGDKLDGTMTRRKLKGTCLHANFELRNVKNTLDNESWVEAMSEEIEQIEENKTWTLVPRPKDKNIIGTKWVFRNKLNKDGKVSRNKARLVCKGYS